MANNDSRYENNSFTFFGPMEMIHDDDDTPLESAELKIVLSVFLLTIMAISILGNTCTCLVIAKEKSMRTPTNAYLFNIAITDLLITCSIPIELHMLWSPDYYPFGEVVCQFHLAMLFALCGTSALTISSFTVERYLVVSKPFLRQTLSKTSRVYKIVGSIWIVSICFVVPEYLNVDLFEKNKSVYCYVTISEEFRVYVVFQTALFFFVPMAIIFVMYTIIGITLMRNKAKRREVNGKQNREKAVRMLAVVAASFFFCWSPTVTMRLMMLFPELRYEFDTWRVVNYLSMLNAYLSTIVNPIVYSLMSHKFQKAFKVCNITMPHMRISSEKSGRRRARRRKSSGGIGSEWHSEKTATESREVWREAYTLATVMILDEKLYC